ncbi:autotransporter outer membrane beta-barrel domain-containing protein [bacterium]|nr:autotransporter outer membrane beta-barrel domain-containing protein [bacterium]
MVFIPIVLQNGIIRANQLIGSGFLSVEQGQIELGRADAGVMNKGGVLIGTGFPSTIQIPGDYTQGETGGMLIRIGFTGTRLANDRLAIGGNATLGGTLTVVTINGVEFQDGDVLDVLDVAGSVSGKLRLILPTLNGTLAFDTTTLMATGIIRPIPTKTGCPMPKTCLSMIRGVWEPTTKPCHFYPNYRVNLHC